MPPFDFVNIPGTVAVRDSKGQAPDGVMVRLTPEAWAVFVGCVGQVRG